MASSGIGPFKNPHVGEYRRFLPPRHPYRTDPSFGPPELRPAPEIRTKERSENGLAIAAHPVSEFPFYQVSSY